MRPPIRLTAVLTHPVQYFAPWFRHIANTCPALDLTVVYATVPTPQQQGTGFGAAFRWDVPLLDGYRSVVVRPAEPDDDVHSGSFWGLDVPEIGPAVLRTDPDVVLVPGWYSVTLVRAIRACRRAGIPLVYRGDSILPGPPYGWRRVARNLRSRYFLRHYSCFLSVGSRSRSYLRRFGVPETRIFASPHCVDNDFFAAAAAPHRSPEARRSFRIARGLAPDAFLALFVGKVEPQKRPSDLIRAAARLGEGAAAMIVGSGPALDDCRREAERLGVKAVWAGFLNQSELGEAYAAADCLVLPSERETWGLVVNEALATGLPCVVSDGVGCAPDLVVPGETGEVYPVGDVAALAAALDKIRPRSADGHDWRPACRERIGRHSFERATVGLVAACEEAVRRRGGRLRLPAVRPPVDPPDRRETPDREGTAATIR